MKNRSLGELIKYIQQNIETGTYVPLNRVESQVIREYYKNQFNLKYDLSLGLFHDKKILDLNTNIKIASGYERIVIGDYGAYFEISPDQIEFDNIYIKQNQSWRLNSEKFKSVKYYWYEVAENSAKIYYQIGLVKYADYRIGYYYVSPDEVIFEEEIDD